MLKKSIKIRLLLPCFKVEMNLENLENGSKRDIEKNPGRAAMVQHPQQYSWSSASFYLKGNKNPHITVNPLYLDLGKNELERQSQYGKYMPAVQPDETLLDRALLMNQRL